MQNGIVSPRRRVRNFHLVNVVMVCKFRSPEEEEEKEGPMTTMIRIVASCWWMIASTPFHPDIGQGVNSGLGDVVALDRALRGVDVLTGKEKKKVGRTWRRRKKGEKKKKKPSLGMALKTYERVRRPEIKALIRLARFGAPYQYRQTLHRDRIGHKLWTMNVLLRLFLNKLTFGLIPTACIMLSQDNDLTFRQVMRRADWTTFGLTMCWWLEVE